MFSPYTKNRGTVHRNPGELYAVLARPVYMYGKESRLVAEVY
jgi:hypothetical protein